MSHTKLKASDLDFSLPSVDFPGWLVTFLLQSLKTAGQESGWPMRTKRVLSFSVPVEKKMLSIRCPAAPVRTKLLHTHPNYGGAQAQCKQTPVPISTLVKSKGFSAPRAATFSITQQQNPPKVGLIFSKWTWKWVFKRRKMETDSLKGEQGFWNFLLLGTKGLTNSIHISLNKELLCCTPPGPLLFRFYPGFQGPLHSPWFLIFFTKGPTLGSSLQRLCPAPSRPSGAPQGKMHIQSPGLCSPPRSSHRDSPGSPQPCFSALTPHSIL